MIEALRAINAIVWIVVLAALFRPMKRAVWTGGASPSQKILAVVWWLAFNRVCFACVSQYTPDEWAALAFCYIFATAGGIAMLIVARSAQRG
ncbi:hypothetical protein [Sphingomonas sp. Marseille-Q8236]